MMKVIMVTADVGLEEASPYMDAPRLQEQSFDDDDTESIAAIHSRLGQQWRVIYQVLANVLLIHVVQITAHDYRKP
jgi:hypothetical protein